MLYVPAPASELVLITLATDEPFFEGMGADGKQRQMQQTYRQFLYGRTADEAFSEAGGKKDGIDLHEIILLARRQIDATVGVRGFHSFDDEVAKRLQAAILHPKAGTIGRREFEHNWIEWALGWKTLHQEVPVVISPSAVSSLPPGTNFS